MPQDDSDFYQLETLTSPVERIFTSYLIQPTDPNAEIRDHYHHHRGSMEEHHDLITSYKYKNWSATRTVVECTLAGQCSCYSRICRRDHFFKPIPGVLKVFSSSTENPIMKLPTIDEDHCVTHFGRPNSVDRYVVSDQEPDRLISGVVERRTVYLFSKVTGRK